MNTKKWRPATGRHVNRLTSNIILPQRLLNLKASLYPALFYAEEIDMFEPRHDSGWQNTGKCPFHKDTRPGSFSVNLDSGAFHCFSCGAAGGDVLAFYQLRYCLDFMTALRDLEGRCGLWLR